MPAALTEEHMLRWIIGTAGTGKTTHAAKLAADLARAETRVVFIVPEQASFSCEKRMLDILGPALAERVEVLSFTRLAETILDAGELPVLSEAGKAVLMSLALESVSEKLDVYKKYAHSLSVANELLKLSAEFKRCMLPPERLSALAASMEEGFLKRKLTEIAVILQAYDALAAQHYTDDADMLTRLAEHLSQNRPLGGAVAILDGFSGFTVQEYAVIEQLLRQAADVYVSLCTDSIRTLHGYDPSAFAYVRRTAEKLTHAARRVNAAIEAPRIVFNEPYRFRTDALRALERIFALDMGETFAPEASCIRVVDCADLYEECAFVAADVKRLLREEGYRCRDIAVLFRDAETYESPVRAALRKCGVPVFEDKRQPILSQPLIALVRGLCGAAVHGTDTQELMQILKSDLMPFTREEIAALENYALLWDLRPSDWRKPFTAHPGGLGEPMDEEASETLAALNALRERLMIPLLSCVSALREADGREMAKLIYDFLIRMQTPERLKALALSLQANGETTLALEQERVWDILMEILDMLARLLEGRRWPAKRFAELLDVVLRTYTLGNIPQGLDEVTVGAVDRIVTDSPRAVYVLGVQEGVFPRTPKGGGLLTDADRRRLRDEMQLELYDFGEIKVSEERFLVYKTLCSARERLTVSACGQAEDGSEQYGSEVIRTILSRFPGCARVHTASLDGLSFVESEETAFEQLCLYARREDGVYPELRAFFEADETRAKRLESLDRVRAGAPLRIADKRIAQQLFGKHMYLSASRVESYYKCPFAFFCKYGLSAKPRKPAAFDAAIQGTVTHYVLETILRDVGRDALLAMTADERQAQVDRVLDEYLETCLGSAAQTNRFLYQYRRMHKVLGEILERLIREFEVCDFVPVDFELSIDRDGQIPPYRTDLPDGGSVQIKGFVDRVDEMDKDGKAYIRVIDYKSGGKTFSLSDVLGGLNLQMLIYLFAIWKNGEAHYGKPVIPAGVLYMPAKADFQKQKDRQTDDAQLVKAKAKALRMDGMILKDDAVILAMDRERSGCFVPVGASVRATDRVIALHEMELLRREVEKLLREMAANLQSGGVEALPARSASSKSTSACDWCDYACVCGWEESDPEREIPKFSHKECLEILSGEVTPDAVD